MKCDKSWAAQKTTLEHVSRVDGPQNHLDINKLSWAPLSVALHLHFHHGKNWHSFSGFKSEKCYNLRGEQRPQNGRIPCMCLQCLKGVENDLPLKSSVRNSLCKTKELGNSEYLWHWSLASCMSFCYYQLLNVWWSSLLVLFFQLPNFTAFPLWWNLTVSLIIILIRVFCIV